MIDLFAPDSSMVEPPAHNGQVEGSIPSPATTETFEEICARLEHWETDPWAIKALLKKEILTQTVVDPCCGTGILGRAAEEQGYAVVHSDIHDWGHSPTYLNNWLDADEYIRGMVQGDTVLMNPPFKHSERFVDKAFEYGARKVVCFQRFPWFEGSDVKGKKRGTWWRNRMPARIWVCGDRAQCHLHSYSQKEREEGGGTKYTFAFFVWEEGHAPAAITGHLFKSEVANG